MFSNWQTTDLAYVQQNLNSENVSCYLVLWQHSLTQKFCQFKCIIAFVDIRYNCCPKMTLLGPKSRYFQIQKLVLNLSPTASVEKYLPSSNYSFELFFSGMKFPLYFFQFSFKAHFTYLILKSLGFFFSLFFFCYFLHLNNFSFTQEGSGDHTELAYFSALVFFFIFTL